MQPIEKPLPKHCVYTASSARDFINYLLPNGKHWRNANRGDLAYRGQASSRWRLVPKAFRKGEKIGYSSTAPTANTKQVTLQAHAEFQAVHEFVKTADNAGLQITNGGAHLLLQDRPRQIFNDTHWEYSWPQPVVWESLALAQHHGVPTRLLDFTEDALVAAFFASSLALDSQNRGKSSRGHLSVWVIDLRFIRSIDRIGDRLPERIGEIRVPRANNAYLNAQFAFFLIDRGANDVMAQDALTSMDQTVIDRARFWHTGNRLKGKKIKQTWFYKFPIMKVRLHITHSAELLRELENLGVSKITIMPSLDRVVESLELKSRIT